MQPLSPTSCGAWGGYTASLSFMGALVGASGVSLQGLFEGEGAMRGYMECPWHQAEHLIN